MWVYSLEHPYVNIRMSVVADSEDEARSQANRIMTHKLAIAIARYGLYLCGDHELNLVGLAPCRRIIKRV
jgi:hypothetical protein